MSMSAVTLTVIESRKTLTASAPFALRELVPVTVTPAAPAAGSCVLTLLSRGAPVAEATLTNGSGTIDLSTAEAVALFTGRRADARVTIDAKLWNTTDSRLAASGRVTLHNNPESARTVLRIAAAGELTMTLSVALAAGQPVLRDSSGHAAACLSVDGSRFIGILRTGGAQGATASVVTSGIVAVAGWGLTPGLCYYLHATNPDAPITATAPDGYNVRPVGIAIDAATLALIPHPVIQTLAPGTPHVLTWEAAGRRLLASATAAASTGPDDAGRVPCLDSAGRLSATMIPDMTAAALAAQAALVANLDPLVKPTIVDLTAAYNALLAILKGT